MEYIRVLGKGSFGTVYLVQQEEKLFALKVIHKEKLNREAIKKIESESRILSRLDHPFVVKFLYACQDQKNAYIAMEYIPGKELFYHFNIEPRPRLDRIRFYLAEILVALSYLHGRGIIYRDIKLENIMLNDEGHIKIIDFGFSKFIGRKKANTICGTHEYLSPEIISGHDYSFESDIWAIGVLCYEMVMGNTPFFHENTNEMYQSILSSEISFPPLFHPDLMDLISHMLIKQPSQRISLPEIKQHPFFRGVDWERVERKGYRLPETE